MGKIDKKLRSDKDGYMLANITNLDGSETTNRVHRIVAETFIPNPSNLPAVNHKDNIKNNNDASNLEWATISYNTWHAYQIGAFISARSKFIKAIDNNGKIFSYYQSCSKMSKALGVSRSRIEKAVKNGNLLNILNLEVVETIPENEIIDRPLFTKQINFTYLNPYKINYKSGTSKIYYNVNEFANEKGITNSSAQLAIISKTKPSCERYDIHSVEKLTVSEYCQEFIIK